MNSGQQWSLAAIIFMLILLVFYFGAPVGWQHKEEQKGGWHIVFSFFCFHFRTGRVYTELNSFDLTPWCSAQERLSDLSY
jgi:hypothetical protein